MTDEGGDLIVNDCERKRRRELDKRKEEIGDVDEFKVESKRCLEGDGGKGPKRVGEEIDDGEGYWRDEEGGGSGEGAGEAEE